MILQGIQAIKDEIAKGLLAQFVPDVLDWVEFRCIWRQEKQPHVAWHRQGSCFVPASPIKHHDNSVRRVPISDLIEEHLHTLTIDVRQDQRVEYSVNHRNGGIGIGVFLGHHRLAHWPDRFGAPASSRIGDPSKARLVLKQHPNWSIPKPFVVDQGKGVLEFFFHSS